MMRDETRIGWKLVFMRVRGHLMIPDETCKSGVFPLGNLRYPLNYGDG